MEHTLENALKAKKLLIDSGFSEDDFSEAQPEDVECGYILGEPLLHNDDDCKSALDLWNEKLFSDKYDDDYVDFMLTNQ